MASFGGRGAARAPPRGRAPNPGQSNILRRYGAPAPRHAARGRGSAILRGTTWGAGGVVARLRRLEGCHSRRCLVERRWLSALSEDVRPDSDESPGISRSVAVQVFHNWGRGRSSGSTGARDKSAGGGFDSGGELRCAAWLLGGLAVWGRQNMPITDDFKFGPWLHPKIWPVARRRIWPVGATLREFDCSGPRARPRVEGVFGPPTAVLTP